MLGGRGQGFYDDSSEAFVIKDMTMGEKNSEERSSVESGRQCYLVLKKAKFLDGALPQFRYIIYMIQVEITHCQGYKTNFIFFTTKLLL